MNAIKRNVLLSTVVQIGVFSLCVSEVTPAEAGGVTWTAKRAGHQSAVHTRQRMSSPGGGTYNGPGDTVGGTATAPPSGLRYFNRVCSPLNSDLCVYDVWIWDYVVTGLRDGFTYYTACHAFSEETLLMQDFYSDQGWTGYPAVTCAAPSTDIFGAALGSHYSVPCSSANPPELTNPLVLDLGADVISTTNVMDLCDLEKNAGY